MAIYRGPGGSGDATTDAANQATVATTKAAEAATSMFQGTYQGMSRIGTIVNLQFVGLVIAAVLGFAYIVQQRRD